MFANKSLNKHKLARKLERSIKFQINVITEETHTHKNIYKKIEVTEKLGKSSRLSKAF